MKCAKNICVAVAVLLLGGCFAGPRDNSGFRSVGKLEELNGLYKNLGEGGKSLQRPLYLSQVIWPEAKDLNHESIHSVKVRAVDENTMIVTAMKEKSVVRESTFTRGKDFELTLGNITLMRVFCFPVLETKFQYIGPMYASGEIGLDQQNDGKLRVNRLFAGVGMLVVPIVAGEIRDVKFLRLEE